MPNNPGRTQPYSTRRKLLSLWIRSVLNAFKAQPCDDCGVEYPPFVMDFDHCRGEKGIDLSRMGSRILALETIIKEIRKCDLVCANCHRIRTFGRNEHRLPKKDREFRYSPHDLKRGGRCS